MRLTLEKSAWAHGTSLHELLQLPLAYSAGQKPQRQVPCTRAPGGLAAFSKCTRSSLHVILYYFMAGGDHVQPLLRDHLDASKLNALALKAGAQGHLTKRRKALFAKAAHFCSISVRPCMHAKACAWTQGGTASDHRNRKPLTPVSKVRCTLQLSGTQNSEPTI